MAQGKAMNQDLVIVPLSHPSNQPFPLFVCLKGWEIWEGAKKFEQLLSLSE
jgi:hypothetical protein